MKKISYFYLMGGLSAVSFVIACHVGKRVLHTPKLELDPTIFYDFPAGAYTTSAGQYPLVAMSEDHEGNSWNYTITSAGMPSDAITNGTQSANLISGTCGGGTLGGEFCVTAGQYVATDTNSYFLLAFSKNGGKKWDYKIDSSNMPADSIPYGSATLLKPGSCSENLCTAGGQYISLKGYVPVLAASTDQGMTWDYKITGNTLPPDAKMTLQSSFIVPGKCVEFLCIAAGRYLTQTGRFPLLYVSNDSGTSWNYETTSSTSEGLVMPNDANIHLTNTFLLPGNCQNNFCIAAGVYGTNSGLFPLLAVSSKSAKSSKEQIQWSYKITSSQASGGVLDLPRDANPETQSASLNSSYCTGNLCIAGGYYTNAANSSFFPLLAVNLDVSINKGNSWNYVITSSQSSGGKLNMPTDAVPGLNTSTGTLGFNSVTCRHNLCLAGGGYAAKTSASVFPLLAVSLDAGKTWAYQITSSIQAGGVLDMPSDAIIEPSGSAVQSARFTNVGCNQQFCYAAGSYMTNTGGPFPLLAVSTDGILWSYKITSSKSNGSVVNLPGDSTGPGARFEGISYANFF